VFTCTVHIVKSSFLIVLLSVMVQGSLRASEGFFVCCFFKQAPLLIMEDFIVVGA